MDLSRTTPPRGARATLPLLLALALPACTVSLGAPPDGSAPARSPRPEARPPGPPPAHRAPRWDGGLAPGATLLIPVQGIGPDQLRDSFLDPRSGGRRHNAIDIMAPRGTPVLAAADGTVHRLRQGGLGGITIYQMSDDGQTMLYYAHLLRYADGLEEGMSVLRGQVIGYVGDTGNAAPGNYHLHFSVGRVTDPDRWWVMDNVNPFPLLAGDPDRRIADR
jgi:peptidoglycan LD-endopeptidase LytH